MEYLKIICKNDNDQSTNQSMQFINPSNKIFMTIDTPKETTYDKEFNSKTKAKTSKSRIVESAPQSSRRKRASSQMVSTEQLDKKKYQSEYEMSFQSMQPGTPLKGNKTSIMSLQDMKNMILNVI